MSDPQDEAFRLDFRVRGGELMASLPGHFQTTIEIAEYGTWLRVRSDEKLAMLVLTRHNGDLVERPVGLFRMRLDDRQLAELRGAVESTGWTKLPRPSRGDVTASQLSIDYLRGGLLIRRDFNARSREFIVAIWPLMEQLNALMGTLLTRPAGAIAVAVASEPDPDDPGRRVSKLILSNPGSWPVVLTDPRVAKPAHVQRSRARILVALAPRETPGMMAVPPRWVSVELPALAEGAPELQTLQAGGKLEIAVPWQAPGPGAYVMQGVWDDYAGPITPADDHLPIMPLRGDDEPAPTGAVYPVRGAAFSVYASFVIEPPKQK
ncbi:hypothetical protein ACNOYE_24310 [Nannocystaceae bacterium ST9]